MCKVLENFTEGKGRNLGLILAIFTRFWLHIYTKNATPGNKTLGSHLKLGLQDFIRIINYLLTESEVFEIWSLNRGL